MADLEKQYKKVSDQLKAKEIELKSLYSERELTANEIADKYQLQKAILDGILKDVKDRKKTSINSLTNRIKKVEEIDREIGYAISSRKAQIQQIKKVKENILLLKQIKANIIRDMDYPDALMKELLKELYLVPTNISETLLKKGLYIIKNKKEE